MRQIYRGDSVKQEIERVHIPSLHNVTIFFRMDVGIWRRCVT